MNKIMIILLTGVMMAMPLMLVLIHSTSTPDVIFSYSTKECVRVEMPDGTLGSCSNLPKKYNHIWGK